MAVMAVMTVYLSVWLWQELAEVGHQSWGPEGGGGTQVMSSCLSLGLQLGSNWCQVKLLHSPLITHKPHWQGRQRVNSLDSEITSDESVCPRLWPSAWWNLSNWCRGQSRQLISVAQAGAILSPEKIGSLSSFCPVNLTTIYHLIDTSAPRKSNPFSGGSHHHKSSWSWLELVLLSRD